jgi:hypothetical protein
MNTFYEIVEESSKLTLDEQESFVDILQKRISLEKRRQLIDEVKESSREFESGDKHTSSIEEIMNEILS